MCMLTYFPPNTQPDREALTNGTIINNDGHGYAIVVPGRKAKLIVRHSLDAKKLIERFAADREKYPHGPALFHSRYGTSGSGGKFNCHPFYMAGDKRTVVAHNGVLPSAMQPDKKDKRCDTRMAADERFSTAYGHLSEQSARDALATDIGAYNKLVILSIDPAYGWSACIINEDSGIWHEGVWYSNHDYQGYRKIDRWLLDWDVDDAEKDDCEFCGAFQAVDPEGQYCEWCETCQDCYAHLDDCSCYFHQELERA